MENYNIIPLFAKPLLETTLPLSLSKIIPFLDKQEMLTGNEEDVYKSFGSRSKNSYILNLPECKPISDYILSVAKDFGTQILNYAHLNYKFTQSWISIKNPGEQHSAHVHPNSLLSGVFYYGKILDNTPSIGFEPEVSHLNLQPSYKNGFNPILETYFLKPKPGTMYLFPSYYKHLVPKNETNLPRKSVAFNIIPTDCFGEEQNLTELKV